MLDTGRVGEACCFDSLTWLKKVHVGTQSKQRRYNHGLPLQLSEKKCILGPSLSPNGISFTHDLATLASNNTSLFCFH